MGKNILVLLVLSIFLFITHIPNAFAAETSANPILILINNSIGSYGRYAGEILKAEGINEYQIEEISTVNISFISNFDFVLLTQMSLDPSQASILQNYVSSGGNLIAFRPDVQLDAVFGLTSVATTTSEGYIKVDDTTDIGNGIVSETIQFHGDADNYNLNGATEIARLYSDATTTTLYPAVTLNSYGSGQAVAFTYDLAKSTALLRQGDPAKAGSGPRPSDLLENYLDANKIPIPQADEQMRLLTNAIFNLNNKKPLPRLWYFPDKEKSLLIMTGDQDGGSIAIINQELDEIEARGGKFTLYQTSWPSLADVQNWTSRGHEFALHIGRHATYWSDVAGMNATYTTDISTSESNYGIRPKTVRHPSLNWFDYVDSAMVEEFHGVQMDFNYYHYSDDSAWFASGGYKNGWMTGSGIPMKFVDPNGKIYNVYQVMTNFCDECQVGAQGLSGAQAALVAARLFNKSRDGFYTAFGANFHPVSWSGQKRLFGLGLMDYAVEYGIPIWNAIMLFNFVDAKNSVTFENITYNNGQLKFDLNLPNEIDNLTVMLPYTHQSRTIGSITLDLTPQSFVVETIKGIEYALFVVNSIGSYEIVASYSPDTTPPVITIVYPINNSVLPGVTTETAINITTDEDADCRYSLTNQAFDYETEGIGFTYGQGTTKHSFVLTSLQDDETYNLYYKCNDTSGNINPNSVNHMFSVAYLDTTPPEWSNQGQSFATIALGEANILYSQGRDLGGLKKAFLSTNETGTWQNFTLTWWNSAWQHRKSITLTENSGNELSDYQVNLDISYVSSKMNSDFSDLRFTDDSDNLLSYYIEDYTADTSANVWVKVPGIPASGSATIYMYYGNPGASSESNGTATFEFFDDFSGTTLDSNKWTEDAVNDITQTVNDYFRFEDATQVLTDYFIFDGTDTGSQHQAKWTPTSEFVVEFNTRINNLAIGEMGEGMVGLVASDNTVIGVAGHHDWSSSGFLSWRGVVTENSASSLGTGVSKHGTHTTTAYKDTSNTDETNWKIVNDGSTLKFYDDDGFFAEASISSSVSKLSLAAGGYAPHVYLDYIQIDTVKVRKYATLEPSISIGTEDSFQSTHGSPMDISGTDWTWSNFTWQNPSIGIGTDVAWRIYYEDLLGFTVTTDIMEFSITGDDVSPVWRNQGQNVSITLPGKSVLLYAEGKDNSALKWAWLSTNETGEWLNYTSEYEVTTFSDLTSEKTLTFGSSGNKVEAWIKLLKDIQVTEASIDVSGITTSSTDLDQQHEYTAAMDNNIVSDQWVGGSFVAGVSGQLTTVSIYLHKIGSPVADAYVRIYNCGGDTPSGAAIASKTITHTVLGTANNVWFNVIFDPPATIVAGNTYCYVVESSVTDLLHIYKLGVTNTDSGYASGTTVYSVNQGASWGTGSYDQPFKTYVSTESPYPTSPTLNIGNTAPDDLSFSGSLNDTNSPEQVNLSITKLNSILSSCDCSGCLESGDYCTVPINVSSESAGIIKLDSLSIKYSTPLRMQENDQWQLASFTWQNDTFTEGTIAWKIYFQDVSGNEGVTDVMEFTVGLDTTPLWRNQGQNTSSPKIGDSVLLYAQGKDDFGLQYAILSTNETGMWVNWTNIIGNWTQTTQADFDAGTIINLTTDVSGIVKFAGEGLWWDSNYQYKKQVDITNNAGSILKKGYSLPIIVDTASLITAGKMLSNGDDLRLVWFNGTELIEIDRINETAFNDANTQVWFSIQKDIPASSVDSNYYLFYGNPSAASAPGNLDKIYGTGRVFINHFSNNFIGVDGESPTNTPTATFVGGRVGTGALIDSATNDIEYTSSEIIYPNEGTIEFWTNRTDVTTKSYFFDFDYEAGDYFLITTLSADQSRIRCVMDGDATGVPTTTQTVNNVWYYVAMTWTNNGTMKCYINGVQEASAVTEVQDTPRAITHIGAYNGHLSQFYLNGVIDEIKIWNYSKDVSELSYIAVEPTTTLGVEQQNLAELTGTLESSSYDAGSLPDYQTISWASTEPGATSIKFRIASNTDDTTWNFIGPDGTSNTYYETSEVAVHASHDGDRYIKYKVYFSRSDYTSNPVLDDVSITFKANNYAEYGSPMDMGGVADTWVLSNFVWQNPSVTEGTVVGWKIYYVDTGDNENVTDVMTFIVGQICVDNDEDGYGDPASDSCTYPELDCDDTDDNINPGATDDSGDDTDENCDGTVVCYDDADTDGYGTTTSAESTFTATGGVADISSACGSNDADSWDDTSDDCDDTNPDVNPEATEVCDGKDNNCDTNTDEGGNALCDDSLFCNGAETCGGLSGCQPGTSVDCSGLDDQCNAGVCNEGSDSCVQDPTPYEGLACNDGLYCTVTDECTSGVCDGSSRDCGDSVSCTDDSCDETNDQCDNDENDANCDSGYYCNLNEDCQPIGECTTDSECTHLTNECNVGKCNLVTFACYADSVADGTSCGDGSDTECNNPDSCSAGTCVDNYESVGYACGDQGVGCLVDDACDGAGSCTDNGNEADGTTCNDGLYCTVTDECTSGVCDGSARDCDDLVLCTDDSCDETNDICLNDENDAYCDLGYYCNLNEDCQPIGECTTDLDCTGLTDECNVGKCNLVTFACYADSVADGTSCDDSDACNVGETCQAGSCSGGSAPNCLASGDQCNDASCDAAGAEGNCDTLTPVSDGTSCDDGLYCTVIDKCTSGVCDGSSRDCSDANECTSDNCVEDSPPGTGYCENSNLAAGTLCGSARDCPADACDGFFAEFYPDDGHDSCDGTGSCNLYSCTLEDTYCTDNDISDGVNTLECGAECDQDSDCADTDCDYQDGCIGSDYYDYDNVANTCDAGCGCTANACGAPAISYNDTRCSTVTRSFSDNTPDQCSELTISLSVDVNEGETYYAIDEVVPSGWVISDPGTGDTSEADHIKWVVVTGATDTVHQYNVDVPCDDSGNYSFNGTYMFESDTEEQIILGETDVDVQKVQIPFDINLKQGWNLISIPFELDDKTAGDIFKDINYNKIFTYTDSKWYELNNNSEINETKSYWIDSLNNQTLIVKGKELNDTTFNLNQGWNLVGYPSLYETSVSDVFENDIVYFYNGSWSSYIPNRSFNPLQTLKPGYGYWVKK